MPTALLKYHTVGQQQKLGDLKPTIRQRSETRLFRGKCRVGTASQSYLRGGAISEVLGAAAPALVQETPTSGGEGLCGGSR